MNPIKTVQRELVGGPKDGLMVDVREDQQFVEIRTCVDEGVWINDREVDFYSHVYEICIDGKYKHTDTKFT